MEEREMTGGRRVKEKLHVREREVVAEFNRKR